MLQQRFERAEKPIIIEPRVRGKKILCLTKQGNQDDTRKHDHHGIMEHTAQRNIFSEAGRKKREEGSRRRIQRKKEKILG